MTELLQHWNLALTSWTVAIMCAVLIGFTKTGIGGLGMIIVASAAMILPAKQSPGILLPMLIFGDILAVSYYHRHAAWRHLLRPMPWAIVGIAVTFLVLKFCPWTDATYRRLIGGICLGCVILTIVKRQRDKNRATTDEAPDNTKPVPWYVVAVVGLIGGFATMAANTAGPIWIVYLLLIGLPKYELVGTGAWFFIILNLLKVPLQMSLGNITGPSLALNVVLFPAIALGAFLGIRVLRRIPQNAFYNIIQWLAATAALKLLLF